MSLQLRCDSSSPPSKTHHLPNETLRKVGALECTKVVWLRSHRSTFSLSSQLMARPLVATSYRYSFFPEERTTSRLLMCSRCAYFFVTLLNTSMSYYMQSAIISCAQRKVSCIFLYLDFVIGGFDMVDLFFWGAWHHWHVYLKPSINLRKWASPLT